MFSRIQKAYSSYRRAGIEEGGSSNQSIPVVRGGNPIWLSDKVDYASDQKRLRVVEAYKSKSRENAR